MKQEKAWGLFLKEMQPSIDRTRNEFLEILSERCGELKETILNMLQDALKIIEKKEKESAVYFYFSLLKVDIIQHRYTLALQVMDDHWHLDEAEIEVYGNLDFLFGRFAQLFQRLNEKRQIFINKIDEYDLQGLMFDELEAYSSTIAHYLRYLLRNIECEEVFLKIPKEESWVIRWGEYESDTELIIQKDLEPKLKREWKKSLLQAEESPHCLAGSYWYQLEINHFECSQKSMPFLCFDQCSLEEIVFNQCSMVGSRFLDTELINCSFVSADLRDVDFSNCRGKMLDFTNANVSGALFSKEMIENSNLTKEQILTVYVKEG